MRKHVVGQHVVEWVEKRLGATFGVAHGLGLEQDGVLSAGVVYNQFTDDGCCIHVAAAVKHWFTPKFARAVFSIPFEQWKYERLTGLVYAHNTQALAFDERIGFVREGVMRGPRPLVVLGMLRSECRWINGNGSQQGNSDNGSGAADAGHGTGLAYGLQQSTVSQSVCGTGATSIRTTAANDANAGYAADHC